MKNRLIIGIRIKFFLAFFLSLAVGIITFFTLNGISRDSNTDYSSEIKKFNTHFDSIFHYTKLNCNDVKKLQKIINNYSKDSFDIFIVDKNGNVKLGSANNYFDKINLAGLAKLRKSSDFFANEINYSKVEKLNDDYLVVTGVLIKYDQFKFLFIALPVFILLFFVLTYGRIKYIKTLTKALKIITGGQLDVKAPVKGRDELSVLAESINQMACELKTNHQKEKEAERTKDELIVNVSHDLRTPLTSIIGYTKLIKEKYSIDADFEKYLGIIDNKLNRLDTLINDLFEYSQLSGNAAEVNKSEVLFNELLRQVIEELIPLGLQNNVEITFSLCQYELLVEADPSKIARVFENVLSNAIKYSSKPGTVEVKTYKEGNKAVSCICNMGSNLGIEETQKIFDRFYRSDAARGSETGGSGIGLSIAKSIVELHKGQIWAECNDEKVCIYVSLDCIS